MMTRIQRPLASVHLALMLLIAACGGGDSVASRSASAYDEAKRKGIPVGGGHEHGGHVAGDTATTIEGSDMAGMDHSKMQSGSMAGMDHSKMQSGGMAGMDHSKMQSGAMAGMDHSKMRSGSMAGMDHSKMQSGGMAGMDHSKMQSGSMAGTGHSKMRSGSMAGMDHSKMQSGGMAGMDHSKMQSGSMAGMDHSKMQSGGMAGMGHSKTKSGSMAGMDHSKMQHGATAAPSGNPVSAVDAARVDPKATLMEDSFDAASAVSVAEAVKAANNVPDGDIRHIVPGQDREKPPASQPTSREGSGQGHGAHVGPASGKPQKPSENVVYTCPMHPEITSGKPGTCPKCGMALVRKKN